MMEIFKGCYSSELTVLCFSLRECFLSECGPAPDVLEFFATKFRGVVTGTFFLSCFASNRSNSLIVYPKNNGGTQKRIEFLRRLHFTAVATTALGSCLVLR